LQFWDVVADLQQQPIRAVLAVGLTADTGAGIAGGRGIRPLLLREELPMRALSLSEAHALAAKGVILMEADIFLIAWNWLFALRRPVLQQHHRSIKDARNEICARRVPARIRQVEHDVPRRI
jgi:hypothetical protein